MEHLQSISSTVRLNCFFKFLINTHVPLISWPLTYHRVSLLCLKLFDCQIDFRGETTDEMGDEAESCVTYCDSLGVL